MRVHPGAALVALEIPPKAGSRRRSGLRGAVEDATWGRAETTGVVDEVRVGADVDVAFAPIRVRGKGPRGGGGGDGGKEEGGGEEGRSTRERGEGGRAGVEGGEDRHSGSGEIGVGSALAEGDPARDTHR